MTRYINLAGFGQYINCPLLLLFFSCGTVGEKKVCRNSPLFVDSLEAASVGGLSYGSYGCFLAPSALYQQAAHCC